jgi:hypothetical protein
LDQVRLPKLLATSPLPTYFLYLYAH